ncbi:MAG: hypothetical protein ACKOWF_15415 [Chloroflexota bacterium]
MAEISRILIGIGSVAAWTGLILYGMGSAELIPGPDLMSKGLIGLVGGLIALVVGIVLYRATREPDLSSRQG